MKVRHLTIAAVPLALICGFAIGWVVRPRFAETLPTNLTVGIPTAYSLGNPPDRRPDISGVVETVEVENSAGQLIVKALIRVRRPPDGRPVPICFDHWREGELVWINVRVPATPVEAKAGSLRVGGFVTAWHDGFQIRTDPAQYYADYIISERNTR